MVSVLRRFSATSCGALLAVCCSQVWADPGSATPFSVNTSYDEFTANIPLQQAETPSVALAQIYIALYHAKQITEAKLCDGKWTSSGTLLYRQGPGINADSRPDNTGGGNQSWHYQSLRQPVALVCPNVVRGEYFLEMSRHLPAWISVRPAGYETTFRLGQVFTSGQHSLATR
ncbi:hypothetical protein MNBD_GAMMA15-1932 [hydrothermal vent metagenome]|uniref:Uncharacterized protein n=1 Tax=hydrothermal vent metagenome TaxID=652676 RepID=A0A3B0Y6B0_9ZZZZ